MKRVLTMVAASALLSLGMFGTSFATTPSSQMLPACDASSITSKIANINSVMNRTGYFSSLLSKAGIGDSPIEVVVLSGNQHIKLVSSGGSLWKSTTACTECFQPNTAKSLPLKIIAGGKEYTLGTYNLSRDGTATCNFIGTAALALLPGAAKKVLGLEPVTMGN